MMTDREVGEAAARGVAVMVNYRNEPRAERAKESMVAAVQSLVAWARKWSLDDEQVRLRIVDPVHVGLLLRYADAEANWLHGEFVAAFDGGGGLMLRKA